MVWVSDLDLDREAPTDTPRTGVGSAGCLATPYCGVPTRIGRIMMAAFGAPFILSAGFLLGSAIFGDDEGGLSNGFLQYS